MQIDLGLKRFMRPLYVLMTLDEFRADMAALIGITHIMVIERNLDSLPYIPECVIVGRMPVAMEEEIIAWCEESFSGGCRVERHNGKIWFELTCDALLFTLRWNNDNE